MHPKAYRETCQSTWATVQSVGATSYSRYEKYVDTTGGSHHYLKRC